MLFTFKDKINKMLHSNLVHKFKCNISNEIYYGKTKGHFKVRAFEHLGITPLNGKKVNSPKDRAVFDHIFHTGHKASFDDFETLVKECDEFRLLLRESILILRDDPPLIDMLIPFLWNFFHDYLQFSFIILIIVLALLII